MEWQGWLEESATRLGEHAGKTVTSAPVQQMGEGLRDLRAMLAKRSATKALWDVRGTIGDAGEGATAGAIRTVAFTGHRTKKVIKKAEAQLGASPHPSPRWSL